MVIRLKNLPLEILGISRNLSLPLGVPDSIPKTLLLLPMIGSLAFGEVTNNGQIHDETCSGNMYEWRFVFALVVGPPIHDTAGAASAIEWAYG